MVKWKPKRKKFENQQGLAKVVYSPKHKKMKVHFHPDVKNDKIADKEFIVGEWPEWVQPEHVSKHEWMVRLGKDKIFSMYPYRLRELVTFEVAGIARGKDKPPMPKENRGEHGSYYTFTTLLKIVDGPEGTVGAIVPHYLHYKVALDESDGLIELTGFGARGVWGPRLEHFWEITGVFDYGPIKFTDNILPEVQKKQLHAKKQIIGQLKDGFVVYDSVDAVGQSWDADSDEALWNPEENATTESKPEKVTETPEPEFEETTETESWETEADYSPVVETEEESDNPLDDWE